MPEAAVIGGRVNADEMDFFGVLDSDPAGVTSHFKGLVDISPDSVNVNARSRWCCPAGACFESFRGKR
jgi:hypothetical protein